MALGTHLFLLGNQRGVSSLIARPHAWRGFTCRKIGSQRKSSMDRNTCCFLTSFLLVAAVVLPVLALDTLLCYYCPLHQKGKSCEPITSECLPDQRCSSSRGLYGSVHILSAQGCVDSNFCGSHEVVAHKGARFNITHVCCCKDKCNAPPKSASNLRKLLGITGKTEESLTAYLEDTCASYTSNRTASQS